MDSKPIFQLVLINFDATPSGPWQHPQESSGQSSIPVPRSATVMRDRKTRVLRGIGAGGQVTRMPMLIGTSGWQYRDWRGGLYPEGVPQGLWLRQNPPPQPHVEKKKHFF